MKAHVEGSLIKGLHIAASGMNVQNKRVLVISQNMANASSRSDENGKDPYRRKLISFKQEFDEKLQAPLVRVKRIKDDPTPFNLVYDPNDPAADANGYIKETNVKTMVELADMREAGRSHEANVKVFEKILQMLQNTVSILKPQH